MVDAAGEELMGVVLLLLPPPPLPGGILRADGLLDAGVSERLGTGSSLRFFAGGAFFVVIAVPFLVRDGAGRFREGAAGGASGVCFSVEGTGMEDSRMWG